MTRPLLAIAPPDPCAAFDARRQAMLRAWREALPSIPQAERDAEIKATYAAMQQLSALDG